MLIEILTFFAVASGLATLACLVGRAAAWLWAGGAPAVMALLAASGEITALVNQDAVAGISLGIAGLLIWAAGLALLRGWQPLSALKFSMLVMASLSYLA